MKRGTSQDLVNTALLLRDTKKAAILIVEGPNDFRLLSRLLRPETGFVVAYGKDLVTETVSALNAMDARGYLGVVDADYDRILRIAHPSNVVAWDYHDMEATLYSSQALEQIAHHFCVEGKLEAFLTKASAHSLREALFSRAARLGSLRLVSQKDGLGLPFDSVFLFRSIDPRTLELDIERVARSLLQTQHGTQKGYRDLAELASQSQSAIDDEHLARGHDISQLFSIGLKRCLATFGSETPSVAVVEAALMAAFSRDDFAQTSIWRDIQTWNEANGESRVVI